MLTQRVDANGATTNYNFDTFGRLTWVAGPTANGSRKQATYVYGLPTTTGQGRTTTMVSALQGTNPAGISGPARWTIYDGIGRAIQTQMQADGSGGANVVDTYYDGHGLAWRTSVSHLVASGAGTGFLESEWTGYGGVGTRSTFDELRRGTQVTLPDGNAIVTAYDGWNRTVLDQNGHQKRSEQDGLGRTVAVKEYAASYGSPTAGAAPYATTAYSYDTQDRLVGVTDALNNGTSLTYDSLGRKTVLQDPDMGTWHYAYDPVGTLNSQTDALGVATSFSYDKLKRPTTTYWPLTWTTPSPLSPTVCDLMELRTSIDTDRAGAGVALFYWTDSAIVAGTGVAVRAQQLLDLRSALQGLWQVASMGSIPQFTRGAIVAGTRLVSAQDLTDLRGWLAQYDATSYGGSHRARVVQQYDSYDGSAQFGRGKRTACWDSSGYTVWIHDAAGRPSQELRTMDGVQYTTTTSYDGLDRPTHSTLPDGEVLTSSYGPNGLLSSLTSSLGATLVTSATYNPLGQPTGWSLGGGSGYPTVGTVQQLYRGLDLPGGPYGALSSSRWLQPGTGTPLVARDTYWDAVGNLTHTDDGTTGEAISYGYDALDRLVAASGAVVECYSYDQVGDLTAKNGQAYSYPAPGSAHPHAVVAANRTSYSYDANGSLTTRGSQTITYDPARRPVRVTAGGTICRFVYDGDGICRKWLDQNGTVHHACQRREGTLAGRDGHG